jgi:hypothetical protein
MTILLRLAIVAAASITPVAAGAAGPDPSDPKAPVPALSHRSVFEHYRRHDDAKPVPWRKANDTVERIGGWRSYAREASPPASAPQAAPPKASGHGVHKH